MKAAVGVVWFVLGVSITTTAAAVPPPIVPIMWEFVDDDGGVGLRITFVNRSTKDVDAFDLNVRFFDAFRRPVRNSLYRLCVVYRRINRELRCSNTNSIQLHYDHGSVIEAADESTYGEGDGYWSVRGFDRATRASVTVTAVHFTDGRIWRGSSTLPVVEEGRTIDPPVSRQQACRDCEAEGGTCRNERAGFTCVPAPAASAAPAPPQPCSRRVDGNCMEDAGEPAAGPAAVPSPTPAPGATAAPAAVSN